MSGVKRIETALGTKPAARRNMAAKSGRSETLLVDGSLEVMVLHCNEICAKWEEMIESMWYNFHGFR